MPALDIVKLRMKIGVHEFEAEGPRDVVSAHFETWKQLAGLRPTPQDSAAALQQQVRPEGSNGGDDWLHTLFAVDAKQNLIALHVHLSGQRRNADAALLILYAYRSAFGADQGVDVPAARLKAALAASGYHLKRLDRTIAPHLTAGLVRKGGHHKRETYALTEPGHQHAHALARKLLETANTTRT